MKITFGSLILFFALTLISHTVLAHPGIGIVSDSKGNIYYTDLTHVWKIDLQGKKSIFVENVHSHELYIDDKDILYGEDEWYEEDKDRWGYRIWCKGPTGELMQKFDDVYGQLKNNTLIRDENYNTYWPLKVNGKEQLMRTDTDGKSAPLSTRLFNDIRWMYYSKQNKLVYVVDNLSLYTVNQRGMVLTIFKDLKDKKREPFFGVDDRHYVYGMCTSKDSDLYLAVFGAQKVLRVGNDSKVSTIYTSPAGWSPCGVTIDKFENGWILESSDQGKIRVVKINRKGERKIYP